VYLSAGFHPVHLRLKPDPFVPEVIEYELTD
jgi:hypothetical protein